MGRGGELSSGRRHERVGVDRSERHGLRARARREVRARGFRRGGQRNFFGRSPLGGALWRRHVRLAGARARHGASGRGAMRPELVALIGCALATAACEAAPPAASSSVASPALPSAPEAPPPARDELLLPLPAA